MSGVSPEVNAEAIKLVDRLCREALVEQLVHAIERLDARAIRREKLVEQAQRDGRAGYGEQTLAAQARVRRRRYMRRLAGLDMAAWQRMVEL